MADSEPGDTGILQESTSLSPKPTESSETHPPESSPQDKDLSSTTLTNGHASDSEIKSGVVKPRFPAVNRLCRSRSVSCDRQGSRSSSRSRRSSLDLSQEERILQLSGSEDNDSADSEAEESKHRRPWRGSRSRKSVSEACPGSDTVNNISTEQSPIGDVEKMDLDKDSASHMTKLNDSHDRPIGTIDPDTESQNGSDEFDEDTFRRPKRRRSKFCSYKELEAASDEGGSEKSSRQSSIERTPDVTRDLITAVTGPSVHDTEAIDHDLDMSPPDNSPSMSQDDKADNSKSVSQDDKPDNSMSTGDNPDDNPQTSKVTESQVDNVLIPSDKIDVKVKLEKITTKGSQPRKRGRPKKHKNVSTDIKIAKSQSNLVLETSANNESVDSILDSSQETAGPDLSLASCPDLGVYKILLDNSPPSKPRSSKSPSLKIRAKGQKLMKKLSLSPASTGKVALKGLKKPQRAKMSLSPNRISTITIEDFFKPIGSGKTSTKLKQARKTLSYSQSSENTVKHVKSIVAEHSTSPIKKSSHSTSSARKSSQVKHKKLAKKSVEPNDYSQNKKSTSQKSTKSRKSDSKSQKDVTQIVTDPHPEEIKINSPDNATDLKHLVACSSVVNDIPNEEKLSTESSVKVKQAPKVKKDDKVASQVKNCDLKLKKMKKKLNSNESKNDLPNETSTQALDTKNTDEPLPVKPKDGTEVIKKKKKQDSNETKNVLPNETSTQTVDTENTDEPLKSQPNEGTEVIKKKKKKQDSNETKNVLPNETSTQTMDTENTDGPLNSKPKESMEVIKKKKKQDSNKAKNTLPNETSTQTVDTDEPLNSKPKESTEVIKRRKKQDSNKTKNALPNETSAQALDIKNTDEPLPTEPKKSAEVIKKKKKRDSIKMKNALPNETSAQALDIKKTDEPLPSKPTESKTLIKKKKKKSLPDTTINDSPITSDIPKPAKRKKSRKSSDSIKSSKKEELPPVHSPMETVPTETMPLDGSMELLPIDTSNSDSPLSLNNTISGDDAAKALSALHTESTPKKDQRESPGIRDSAENYMSDVENNPVPPTKSVPKTAKMPKAKKSFRHSTGDTDLEKWVRGQSGTASSSGENTPQVEEPAHLTSLPMTFKIKELETAFGIKRKLLGKMDAKTLDKLVLEKAQQKAKKDRDSPEKIPGNTLKVSRDSTEDIPGNSQKKFLENPVKITPRPREKMKKTSRMGRTPQPKIRNKLHLIKSKKSVSIQDNVRAADQNSTSQPPALTGEVEMAVNSVGDAASTTHEDPSQRPPIIGTDFASLLTSQKLYKKRCKRKSGTYRLPGQKKPPKKKAFSDSNEPRKRKKVGRKKQTSDILPIKRPKRSVTLPKVKHEEKEETKKDLEISLKTEYSDIPDSIKLTSTPDHELPTDQSPTKQAPAPVKLTSTPHREVPADQTKKESPRDPITAPKPSSKQSREDRIKRDAAYLRDSGEYEMTWVDYRYRDGYRRRRVWKKIGKHSSDPMKPKKSPLSKIKNEHSESTPSVLDSQGGHISEISLAGDTDNDWVDEETSIDETGLEKVNVSVSGTGDMVSDTSSSALDASQASSHTTGKEASGLSEMSESDDGWVVYKYRDGFRRRKKRKTGKRSSVWASGVDERTRLRRKLLLKKYKQSGRDPAVLDGTNSGHTVMDSTQSSDVVASVAVQDENNDPESLNDNSFPSSKKIESSLGEAGKLRKKLVGHSRLKRKRSSTAQEDLDSSSNLPNSGTHPASWDSKPRGKRRRLDTDPTPQLSIPESSSPCALVHDDPQKVSPMKIVGLSLLKPFPRRGKVGVDQYSRGLECLEAVPGSGRRSGIESARGAEDSASLSEGDEPRPFKYHNTPNGITYPVTPPHTPEHPSLHSGEAEQPEVREVTGVDRGTDYVPLCCCRLKGASINNSYLTGSGQKPTLYCQALDSINGKIMGCTSKVKNTNVLRPALKIPFMALCELHRERLRNHQCCPGCGQFCAEGYFLQCGDFPSDSTSGGAETPHYFHRQCQISRANKYFCPHCAKESAQCELKLKSRTFRLSSSRRSSLCVSETSLSGKSGPPGSLLGKPRPLGGSRRASARMSCVEAPPVKSEEELLLELPSALGQLPPSLSSPSASSVHTDTPYKVLSLGPAKVELENTISILESDRAKKARPGMKNLYKACKQGDVEKVVLMLAEGCDPNQGNEEQANRCGLHAAAESGHHLLVHLLLQGGANPDVIDDDLKTPFLLAASEGHVQSLKILHKAGARVEAKASDGMTSLHLAAEAGRGAAVKFILETKKLGVNVTDDGGWTALIWAAEHSHLDIVHLLLEAGADPNVRDVEGNTALHWAAYSGSVDIAEIFLNARCDMEAVNELGDRPLHIAARQDHYETIVLLLARGADSEARNNANEAAISCCVEQRTPSWLALKVNQLLRALSAGKLHTPDRLLHRDISYGREANHMPVVNVVDEENYPTDFLYIMDNVETTPMNVNRTISSLQSCACKENCGTIFCECSSSSVRCWYRKDGRLIDEINFSEPPLIFECNKACRCWSSCQNRVVQLGITSRLQVFRTSGRGWGARTLLDIPRGTFVCEYIGELLSDAEADSREDDSYLFDLDNKDSDTFCIDARRYGNVSRFINHLCNPNLVPVKVFIEHQDLRFPRICFFASRDIKAYEELGFDYGEKFWIIKWKQFTCTCGSPKCRYSKETIHQTLEEYNKKQQEDEDSLIE